MGSMAGVSSPLVDNAFKYAKNHGVHFIISAGNDGGPVSYPASDFADIIAGATDTAGTRPLWSSYPTNASETERYVSAPGVDVELTTPAWYSVQPVVGSGTSFSAPNLMGVVVAQMLQGFSVDQAIQNVLDAAISVNDARYGLGLAHVPGAQYRPLIRNIGVPGLIQQNGGTVEITAEITHAISAKVRLLDAYLPESSASMEEGMDGTWTGSLEMPANTYQPRQIRFLITATSEDGLTWETVTPWSTYAGSWNRNPLPTVTVPLEVQTGSTFEASVEWTDGHFDTVAFVFFPDSSDPQEVTIDTSNQAPSATFTATCGSTSGTLVVYVVDGNIILSRQDNEITFTGDPCEPQAYQLPVLAGATRVEVGSKNAKIFWPQWQIGPMQWLVNIVGTDIGTTQDEILEYGNLIEDLPAGSIVWITAVFEGEPISQPLRIQIVAPPATIETNKIWFPLVNSAN